MAVPLELPTVFLQALGNLQDFCACGHSSSIIECSSALQLDVVSLQAVSWLAVLSLLFLTVAAQEGGTLQVEASLVTGHPKGETLFSKGATVTVTRTGIRDNQGDGVVLQTSQRLSSATTEQRALAPLRDPR